MTKRGLRDFPAELARLRARAAELAAEHYSVAAAAVPLVEAEARVDAYLNEQADARAWFSLAAPALAAPAAEEGWRTGAMPRFHEGDVLPLLVRAARDAVRSVLVEEARRHLERHGPGLAEAERAARLAELAAELWQVERAEEGLVVEAEALGIALDRRPDADPRAVLELVGEPPQAAA